MNHNKIGRRAFLSSVTAAASIPVLSAPGVALEGYNSSAVTHETLVDTSKAIAAYDKGMIELADPLSVAYEEAKEESREIGLSRVHAFELERLTPDTPIRANHVRPVLKMIEVLDENLGISLPNYKLIQAWNVGTKLTTIGGILHACKAIGRNAAQINRIQEDDDREITDDHRISFGISILTLAAELAFLAFPVNFTFAWRTTRYATNRGLYLLGRLPVGNQIQAVVMSLVHWSVRDVPSRLAEYLLNGENLRTIYDRLESGLNEVHGDTGLRDEYDVTSMDKPSFVDALAKSGDEYVDGVSEEEILREAASFLDS